MSRISANRELREYVYEAASRRQKQSVSSRMYTDVSRSDKIKASLSVRARRVVDKRLFGTSVKIRLDERFFGLPVELQLMILNFLSLQDLLSLRKVSQRFRAVVTTNEFYLAKCCTQRSFPPYVTRLFPPSSNTPQGMNLKYACSLAERQRTSSQLAYYLARQIMKELLGSRRRLRRIRMDNESTKWIVQRLQQGMTTPIFHLLHFFRTYSLAKLERGAMLREEELAIQARIMNQYSDRMLSDMHETHRLLLGRIHSCLSAPTVYIRGHRIPLFPIASHPKNDDIAKLIMVGGIGKILDVYCIKGCWGRIRELDRFVESVNTLRGESEPQSWLRRVDHKISAVIGSRNKMEKEASASSHVGGEIASKLAQIDVGGLDSLWPLKTQDHPQLPNMSTSYTRYIDFIKKLVDSPESYDDYYEPPESDWDDGDNDASSDSESESDYDHSDSESD